MKPRREKRGVSIQWQLFRWLALFTGIILLILWLCQVVFLDVIYKAIKIHGLERDAAYISEHINSPQLKANAEHISQRDDLCLLGLQMVDINTGYPIFSHCANPDCAIHNTSSEAKFVLYDAAVENGGSVLQRFRYDSDKGMYYSVDNNIFSAQTKDMESIVYTFVTENARGETLLIILNTVISPVTATVHTLNALLCMISVILILLALLMAWLISRQVAGPVVRMNNAAKALAERDYSVQFDEHGYREIRELGRTLNYATRELSKVDDLCRELIANISHDLRTPLTMIQGYGEVMRDIPGENTPENVQIVIDEANRLTTLVNDVLDIASFQNGWQKFVSEPFCLTDAVRQTLTRYNKLVERSGYHMEFLADGEIWVDSDEGRIIQVVCNLINNAMTYTGADKRVTISQLLKEDIVRIEVTDTGEGIPEDKLEFIWERYYRVDKVHKRAAVGSGLGLSIVRHIIDMAGGRCGVRSKPGQGSTFWFELRTISAPKNDENS